MKKYWLMKTEPSVFSFNDLTKAPGRKTPWEGVRNYQARNLMRDQIKCGDEVLIYHSNTEAAGVYGVAEVVKESTPDTSAMNPKSPYADPQAIQKGSNPWVLVEVKATAHLKSPVTRDIMRDSPDLKEMMVLKKGARLSVQPVSPEEFRTICKLGGIEKIRQG